MNIRHVLAVTALIVGSAGPTHASPINNHAYQRNWGLHAGTATDYWPHAASMPYYHDDVDAHKKHATAGLASGGEHSSDYSENYGDEPYERMERSDYMLINDNNSARTAHSNDDRHSDLKRAEVDTSIIPTGNDIYHQDEQQLVGGYDVDANTSAIPEPASLALLALGFLLLALRLRKTPFRLHWCEPAARQKQPRPRYASARLLRTDRRNNMLAFKYFHQKIQKPIFRHRVKPVDV